MALEAVVFPQDPFGYSTKDPYNLVGWSWSYGDDQEEEDFLRNQTENISHDYDYGEYYNWQSSSMGPSFNELYQSNDPFRPEAGPVVRSEAVAADMQSGSFGRRRRRLKSQKNKEEIESQRMTHITVERNRRKQMNEYLSVLRSLMPDSYVQRGDQASIIGGAINFVKELEQQVQSLSAQTDVKSLSNASVPFSHFFTFPQYSSTPSSSSSPPSPRRDPGISPPALAMSAAAATNPPIHSATCDIEVTLVDSHANVKIRSRKLPKLLLKIVSGLHLLRLSVLHLNVSTADQIVLYSLNVKVEDDCGLSSADEIARALHQLLGRIQEEAFSNV